MNIPQIIPLISACKRSSFSGYDEPAFCYRKPAFFRLTVSLLVILTLASCGVSETNTASTGTTSSQDASTATSGQVKIVGSTALLPLAAKAADLFHHSHPNIQINVEGGGSLSGLDAVTNHKADIGDSDLYADPSVYPDPNLTDHIVCATSFVLIVNPQITITSLSTQQITDIFSAKIVNWQEVGGPNLPITPVIRPSNSGTRALFEKYILGGSKETGTPIDADSSTTVLDTVAHTSGAIGYVTAVTADSTVRTIAIDRVSPTIQNIQSGKYKFWGYEHMYTLQNGINATTEFLDFMQSSQIQQLAQQLGYISVDSVKSLSPSSSMNS